MQRATWHLASLLILSTLLGGLLAACTAARRYAADAGLEQAVSAPPAPVRTLGVVHAVSLPQLERQVRQALPWPHPAVAPLTVGGLTDLWGYRWNRERQELELLGEVGEGPPLLVDEFVMALRMGHYPAIGMNLIPQDPLDPASPQLVHVFPPELGETRLVVPLIQAEYTVKTHALQAVAARYRDQGEQCAGRTTTAMARARLFFVPAMPELAFEETPQGFTIQIRQARLMLRAERDVVVASGTEARPLPPGHPLADFAADFSRRLADLERQEPVYQQLQRTYRLFLIAQLLRKEFQANEIVYDVGFWLHDYPVAPYPPPRALPPFPSHTIQRICGG